MPKYCLNYDTGDYEWIDENGYSIDRGEYVYNWDNSEYRREEERHREEEGRSFWQDDGDDNW